VNLQSGFEWDRRGGVRKQINRIKYCVKGKCKKRRDRKRKKSIRAEKRSSRDLLGKKKKNKDAQD